MTMTQEEKAQFAGIAAAQATAIKIVIEQMASQLGPAGFGFVKNVKASLLAAAQSAPAQVAGPLTLLAQEIRTPASH